MACFQWMTVAKVMGCHFLGCYFLKKLIGCHSHVYIVPIRPHNSWLKCETPLAGFEEGHLVEHHGRSLEAAYLSPTTSQNWILPITTWVLKTPKSRREHDYSPVKTSAEDLDKPCLDSWLMEIVREQIRVLSCWKSGGLLHSNRKLMQCVIGKARL